MYTNLLLLITFHRTNHVNNIQLAEFPQMSEVNADVLIRVYSIVRFTAVLS